MSLFLTLLILGTLYFLPTIIAASNGHRNTEAICALNIFLGWTVLGWIVAVVWSFTDNRRPQQDYPVLTDAVDPKIRKWLRNSL